MKTISLSEFNADQNPIIDEILFGGEIFTLSYERGDMVIMEKPEYDALRDLAQLAIQNP